MATATHSIRDIMTSEPITLTESSTLLEAARCMRDSDIGEVIVMRGDNAICGVVTDRDIVVRGLAEDMDPRQTTLREVCTAHVVTIDAGADPHDAAALLREHKVRRLPVMEDGELVGIVSIGDVALDIDRESALAEISDAPPNN